jgi:hypothetical protein
MKKLLSKPIFKNLINPIFRAVTKTLVPPLGTGIEIVKNLITPKGEKQPHNWTSIVIQIICWGAIIYAFGSKMITLTDLLELFGFGK